MTWKLPDLRPLGPLVKPIPYDPPLLGSYSGLDRKIAKRFGVPTSGTNAALHEALKPPVEPAPPFTCTMEDLCEGPSIMQKITAQAAEHAVAMGWRSFHWRRDDRARTYTLAEGPG